MKRYTVSDINNGRFYQVPKFLFEGKYKELSNDSRILYSLLKDRHELSLKNEWFNENGEVYLIYTREEMCNILGKSLKTTIKIFNSLKEYGLIEEERQGHMRPNLIYLTTTENSLSALKMNTKTALKDDMEKLQLMTCNNYTSRHGKITTHDMEILHPINTYLNDTNNSDTESYQSINETKKLGYDGWVKSLYELLDYQSLVQKRPHEENRIQEIIDTMIEVYLDTSKSMYRINRKMITHEMVVNRFNKITYDHMIYILDCIDSAKDVKNIKAYLLTTLYNAPVTMANYYSQKANELFGYKN